MKKRYDFSKGRRNPYAKLLKRQLTIRLDEATIAYFKNMAETAEIDSDIDLERAQKARAEAEKALEGGFVEGADLSAARAELQRALVRIRVAEHRRREGPRSRG